MIKSILLVTAFVFLAWLASQIYDRLDRDETKTKRKKVSVKLDRQLPMPYVRREQFFTEHEERFYRVLRDVLKHPTDPNGADQAIVLSKVRVADLVQVKSGLERSENQSAFNRIKSKHVDFVLLDPGDLRVLCVVELDDASHNTKKVRERDALMDGVYRAAGIPIAHVRARRGYVKEEVAGVIRGAMGK